MDYQEFLESKKVVFRPSGFTVTQEDINPALFDFQRDIVIWALKKGKAAIFAMTGLGKTLQQAEWSRHVCNYTGGDVLILAPLAVSQQTVREGAKFGIAINICRSQEDVRPGINITNYEMLHKFDPDHFAGIVLDESGILKSFESKTRNQIISAFRDTPFKLACTATPAPNDHMELGNHAEFIGVMSRTEMLSMFFVHDGGDTSKWRVKGHARDAFWEWVASWAVMLSKPSDLGYDDGDFNLPPLNIHEIVIPAEGPEAKTLTERRQARKDSIDGRVAVCAELVNQSDEPWIVWCGLNAESEALTKAIDGAVEVRGSHSPEYKEKAMLGFATGEFQKIVSKPSIMGFGMNYQHCSKMAFVGLSDSFEEYFQAVRRCWRFGQTKPVDVYVITSEAEGAVVANIKRKEADFAEMLSGMIAATQEITKENIRSTTRDKDEYVTDSASGEGWTLDLGDCVELIRDVPDDSIHYSIFSPPFGSLFVYSNSDRDMGNCRTDEEFYQHFSYLVRELYRVLIPGRLVSFHCMDLPYMKSKDGFIGLKDFPSKLREMFEAVGFIYHSKVTIWKDPVTEVTRTKALGLLHKQLKKDSAMSRQGLSDYLVTMRKPGDNLDRVTHTDETFPVAIWQKYASPVWMDIRQGDTLQKNSAREEEDERHIAPLQLGVIRRALGLWTNPGDVVYEPFAGIASVGYVALQMGRRFKGNELKRSYWVQGVGNLKKAKDDIKGGQLSLLDIWESDHVDLPGDYCAHCGGYIVK